MFIDVGLQLWFFYSLNLLYFEVLKLPLIAWMVDLLGYLVEAEALVGSTFRIHNDSLWLEQVSLLLLAIGGSGWRILFSSHF